MLNNDSYEQGGQDLRGVKYWVRQSQNHAKNLQPYDPVAMTSKCQIYIYIRIGIGKK